MARILPLLLAFLAAPACGQVAPTQPSGNSAATATSRYVDPLADTPALVIPDAVILPGERAADVHIRLSGPARRPLAFRWQAGNGNMTYAPFHYPAGQGGWIMFQPGETDKVVRVVTNRDLGFGGSMQIVVGWSANNPPVPGVVTGRLVEAATRPETTAALPRSAPPPPAMERGRRLIFSSDFMEPVGPNPAKGAWRTRFNWGRTQTGNGELAPNADATTDPGTHPHPIVGGKRVLRAEHVPVTDRGIRYAFSAAAIQSQGLFTFSRGYIELRAKIDRAQGTIPAFWLMPADNSWPPEIDIFEVGLGDSPTVAATLHDKRFKVEGVSTRFDPGTGWHRYGLDVTDDWIVWTVDGRELVRRPNIYPASQRWFAIINVAVGGLAPAPAATPPGWHSDMTLDYLKIWQ